MLGAVLALSTLLLVTACDKVIERPPISQQQYVDIYVEILRAADEEPDEVAASQRAQEILDRRGVSQEDLLGFAEHYADDPEYLSEVWLEIERRLRSPEPQDSSNVEDRRRSRDDESTGPSGGR